MDPNNNHEVIFWDNLYKLRPWLCIVGMIINNEHKLCRAFDRLLKSETPLNYVHCTQLGLMMLAYHIIRASAEARSRDLPVTRRALYHWATDPLKRASNCIRLDFKENLLHLLY